MNTFEKFLLDFAKGAAAAAPSVAPIFVHSAKGIAIFNASDELSEAFLTAFTPPAPAAK